jgi:hypothetical protein
VFSLHRLAILLVLFALVLAASSFLSGVARAVRRGGWIHLFAVAGRNGRIADACPPG